MTKTAKILSLLLAVAIMISLLPALNVMALNPYVPLWEHLPDGEPKVFEDPDNPGKYRAYIFGSHDVRYSSYCGPDIRAWSAPVEDLTNWRDEGSVFKYYISGQWDVFYAPDVVELRRKDGTKEYYLYPHSRGANRIAMVCKSNRPDGPYTPINMTADGTRTVSGSILGFDPAVWIEYVTDPNDPDYEIGFRAYAYWGYAGSNEKSWACQLDQNTMYSVRPGTQAIQYFMPCSSSYGNINDPAGTTYPYIYPDEDLKSFNFFEASSIRKIGNKYIMLYSGYSGPDYGLSSTNSALRYCYGDTPLGPWRSGGVLVDSRAPVLNQDGTSLQTSYSGHNTHGSLLEINGNWYCFYHRAPRGYGYARQPMVAPVKITWDEKPVSEGGKVVIRAFDPYSEDNTWTAKDSRGYEYTGAEVTSEGFEVFGLDPYKYYSAGYACYLSSTGTQQDSFDIWDNNMPITNVQNGHRIGYKYFGFGGLDEELACQFGLKPFEGTKPGNNTEFNLFLTPKTTNAFKINVWLDGPWANDAWKGTKIGEINVPAGSEQVVTKFSVDVSEFVDNLDKKHAIFLVAEGGSGNLFDLIGLGFSSDTKDIEYVAPPEISILADGVPLVLPTTPVRSTNANGICDYDLYEVNYAHPDISNIPLVTAACSDKNVKITISQASSPTGVAVVRFNKDGVIKTYRVLFTVSENQIYNPDTWNIINPRDPENPVADITPSGDTVTIQSKPGENNRYPQLSNILQLPNSTEGNWTATVTMTLNENLRGTNNESVAVGTNAGFAIRDPEKGLVEENAEYCSVAAEKLNTTLAGAGARAIGRVGGTQTSSTSSNNQYFATGTTYQIRMRKSGNTVSTSYLRSNGNWTNLRSYTFDEEFFENAKFELFVHNPNESTPISAQFTVNITYEGGGYTGEEGPNLDAVERAASIIGNSINASSYMPAEKAAEAESALASNEQLAALGVDIKVSYDEDKDLFILTISKGNTSMTIKPFIIYSPFVSIDFTSNANLVKKGDYFDIKASFSEPISANVVRIALNYDSSKFEYAGNLGADPSQDSYIEGVTYLSSERTDTGMVFILMIPDYNALDLLSLRFRAKEDADIQNADNTISASADIVYRKDDDKIVIQGYGSFDFTTGGVPGDTDLDGKVTLIDLSNVIDMFGIEEGDPLWIKAKFFDFNKNGMIDIADIVAVAKLVE